MCPIWAYVNHKYMPVMGILFWAHYSPKSAHGNVWSAPTNESAARDRTQRGDSRIGRDLLEYRDGCVALPHDLDDTHCALRRYVANLHSALGIHGNRMLICRVIRLVMKFDRIARRAQSDLEASTGALALVRVVGADYRKGNG